MDRVLLCMLVLTWMHAGSSSSIRRWDGYVLLVALKGMIGNFSPRAAELYTASLGLHLARNRGYSHVLLEIDDKEVVLVDSFNSNDGSWASDGALSNAL
ncbi:hypothetical protein ACLB2K_062880 [Fragaria x ananassa]